MRVTTTSWDDIKKIWESDLWLDRTSPIKPTSSMILGGGYDLSYHANTPIFWKIIDSDGSLVGVQSGHLCAAHQFRVRGLWIDPRYRGQGFSQMLFDNAVAFAKSIGCSEIWSYPRNSSLGVYLRHGFKVIGGPITSDTEIHGPYFFVSQQLLGS